MKRVGNFESLLLNGSPVSPGGGLPIIIANASRVANIAMGVGGFVYPYSDEIYDPSNIYDPVNYEIIMPSGYTEGVVTFASLVQTNNPALNRYLSVYKDTGGGYFIHRVASQTEPYGLFSGAITVPFFGVPGDKFAIGINVDVGGGTHNTTGGAEYNYVRWTLLK